MQSAEFKPQNSLTHTHTHTLSLSIYIYEASTIQQILYFYTGDTKTNIEVLVLRISV
jgi:hypothetical protein